MKELSKKQKDKVVITKQQEVEQTLEFHDTIIPHSNHTLWEISVDTLEIKKAVFNLNTTLQGNWNWKKGDKIQGALSLVRNNNCEYVSALTKETALKHFKKNSSGTKFTNTNFLKLS